MPLFAANQCFSGLGGQFARPLPYFKGAGLKSTICAIPLKSFNTCLRAASAPKNTFLPENGETMPIFGPNQCFWGLGGQFVPPLPYFKAA